MERITLYMYNDGTITKQRLEPPIHGSASLFMYDPEPKCRLSHFETYFWYNTKR